MQETESYLFGSWDFLLLVVSIKNQNYTITGTDIRVVTESNKPLPLGHGVITQKKTN